MDKNTKVTITGKVNGNVTSVAFSPQDLTVEINGVDFDSGRMANGMMERNMVAEKRKATISLPPMHSAELQEIMSVVCGLENASLQATIPDPWLGTYSGTFYVGDRSAPIYNCALDIWNKVSFSIVEY